MGSPGQEIPVEVDHFKEHLAELSFVGGSQHAVKGFNILVG